MNLLVSALTGGLAVRRGASFRSLNMDARNLRFKCPDRLLYPVDRRLLKIRLTALLAEPAGNRVDDEMVSVPVNRIRDLGPHQLSSAEMALQTLRPPRLLVL